jgi:hypothetical protein
MKAWRLDPSMPMELLNGAGMVIELFFIVFLSIYLWRETQRRGFGFRGWWGWHLPPSMNLAVAVMAFDIGVFVRTAVVWAWRRFYQGSDFGTMQVALLALGAIAILVGGLCKIRAVSFPDYGHGPWLATAGATALFAAATVYFR